MSELLTADELREELRELLRKRTLRELGDELGIAFQSLSLVLNGDRGVGLQIPAALGYEPVTLYRRVAKKKGRR